MKRTIFILLVAFLSVDMASQTGGDNIYEFLNLTHSGLVTSVGGTNVSLYGNNLNLAYHNPALLNNEMDRSLSLNYVNYFAGINYGLAMYSRSYEKAGSFAAGVTYLNYGSFREADPSGNITGTFTASEYAFSFIWSKNIDSLFSFGINFKPVLSHLEKYTSFGFAFDAGASYHSSSRRFTAGLVIRNAGMQVTSYAGEARQKLPFEIQAGLSQKLVYAPLRFSLTLTHLEKFDLTYQDKSFGIDNSEARPANSFFGNMIRHVVAGAEIIPHKSFYMAAGYDFRRAREMQTTSKGSMAGFTWGFGINTAWLDIGMGRAVYHLAGSSTHISLIIRPDKIYKKQGS